MFLVICSVILIVFIIFAVIARKFYIKPATLRGKHVIITGGSSGIGKSIAIQAAQLGASVTILARNKLRLEEAKTEIQAHLQPDRKVQCLSVDLTQGYQPVQQAIHEAEEKFGPVFMLINSAGTSISGTFNDLNPDDFKKLMETNYLSAVYASKAVVGSMMSQRAGRIVFLSSQGGQIGLYGFTAYSGAKFALRGMAEALQMEMTPHNVRVTVAFPPDTDTPGYQNELIGKPKETILISETAGLLKPDDVAKCILNDSLAGQFVSYQGLDGWMLANISAGMSPATSLLDVLTQATSQNSYVFSVKPVLSSQARKMQLKWLLSTGGCFTEFALMGILRVVGLFYLASFDKIVMTCKRERDTQKKKSS